MVRNIPFISRENYSPREQWPTNDRYINDSPINPHHFSGLSTTRSSVPVQAIETALREQCGIQVKDFAMIATLENGTTATFTSEKLIPQEKYLFNQEFKEMYFRHANGPYGSFPAQTNYNDFDSSNNSMRRQSSSTDSSNGTRRNHNRIRQNLIQEDSDEEDNTAMVNKGRKRLRGSQDDDDEKPPMMGQSVRIRNLTIGDTEEVTKFFESRFRDLQQAACKIIAKAFVKVVEPKKQTNHPYTGGAERAPKWWPPLPSANKTGGVKHKEPDHLLKPERIALLIHILRLKHIPESDKDSVTIRELQSKTKESMLTWFNDKPENKAKSKYLDEIFKVARAEERYMNGEIDASTTIPVMHGADQCVPDLSDDEADDAVKDEDDETMASMTPQSQQICTPDSMVSPTSTHSQNSMHSIHRPISANTVPGFNNYHREMPVRQYQHNTSHTGLLPRPDDQSTYENDSLNMGVQSFLPPRMADIQQQHQNHGLPDQSRRPTWNANNSFPTNSSNIFTDWPNNNTMMRSSSVQFNPYPAVAPTPLASNGPLLPLPNTTSTSLLPPMMNHNSQQNVGANNFNDTSTMNFRDQSVATTQHSMGGGHHNSLRTGSLSNPHHQYHTQQPAYMNDYWHDSSAHGDAVMKDENLGGGG